MLFCPTPHMSFLKHGSILLDTREQPRIRPLRSRNSLTHPSRARPSAQLGRIICTASAVFPHPSSSPSFNHIPGIIRPPDCRFRHAAEAASVFDPARPCKSFQCNCPFPVKRDMMITIIGAVLLSMRTQIIRTENSDLASPTRA